MRAQLGVPGPEYCFECRWLPVITFKLIIELAIYFEGLSLGDSCHLLYIFTCVKRNDENCYLPEDPGRLQISNC